MLFLLNTDIVELNEPEAHLSRRWRVIGCGDPNTMRAQDAIEFVRCAVSDARAAGYKPNRTQLEDYAALISMKTGANSLLLKPRADGSLEARLQDVPQLVLETYQRGAANQAALNKTHVSL